MACWNPQTKRQRYQFEEHTITGPVIDTPTDDVLELFEDDVRDYFTANFPAATPVQTQSWPVIAAGHNALITAPTGSGKTLTAFLWALNKYARGDLAPGVTSILYISPLKALNNDIQKNLLDPLAELERRANFPSLQVKTRSGDTPQSERAKMLRRPPEILITTPESLGLLLTSVRGRNMLSHVDTVILDEVHSIVSNRRGVQLLCALERLCWMGIEPQRIALSATVNPLEQVAAQVAGYTAEGTRRAIKVITADQHKTINFRVKLPDGALQVADRGQKIWEPLTDAFKERLQANSSTLFFTNSRRLAEKITLKLNQDSASPVAYAHHGSLAKDIRHSVEQKLKGGDLRAIVATSSLEMGIDIGDLDEVVLIQSPPSVSASLQRIGRSGHRVGETSIGTLFPTHAHDFLEAAALSTAVQARDIEPLAMAQNPLDLLAQLVIATTASEDWNVDELFALFTRAAPYHSLRRDHYDGVIEMLAGRYAGLRLRDLKPRITFDRLNNTIRATRGAVMAYYSSGGTIPDRGYFKLRHASTGQVIGELDEEFVWEATVGQTFNLGTGHWQIHRITHDDVLVNPAPTNVMAPPFWRSESVNRDFHFSTYIGQVLETAERALHERADARFTETLTQEQGFDEPAADALVDYLRRQRDHSGPLPGPRNLLLEQINTGPAGYRSSGGEKQLVIHTFWGARVNRPFGLALANAWREHFGEPPELQADNDALIVQLGADIEPDTVVGLVTRDNLHRHLRDALEDSDFFGARFRECAGRALLLSRKKFNQRLPLWMTRLQSKKLLAATKVLTDFPILLEAWRTCLEDEFDLLTLERLLEELQDGDISWRFVESRSPSPFAANLSWNQINQYMYADDTPGVSGRSNLQDDLIASALADRPSVTAEIIEEFLAKRQRLHPDYAPEDDADWLEWIKERLMLPAADVPPDLLPNSMLCDLAENDRHWVCHAENAHVLVTEFGVSCDDYSRRVAELKREDDPRDKDALTQEILSFHGPLTEEQLHALLPRAAWNELTQARYLIQGQLVTGRNETLLCDAENFEILLRFQRRASRATVEPKALAQWPGWTAHWQNAGAATLDAALECLRGYRAPVSLWLNELVQTRMPDGERLADNLASDLSRAFINLDMNWLGTSSEKICLDYAEDIDVHAHREPPPEDLSARFKDPRARYAFTQLLDAGTSSAEEFNEQLWRAAWLGQVTSDTLDTLVAADKAGYKLSGHSSSRRARRISWPGAWSMLQPTHTDATDTDPLERLELQKQAARTLLDRYGIVCRELANREGGPYRFRELFGALRVMELAGEVVAGAFFTGLSGPQFATPTAVREFTAMWTPRDLWLSALDPISPSGMGLDWEQHGLPHRRAGNHYALVAGEVALISENNGARLTFIPPPDSAAAQKACALLGNLCRVVPRIALSEINTTPARRSPYLKLIKQHFDVQGDHKGLYIERSTF